MRKIGVKFLYLTYDFLLVKETIIVWHFKVERMVEENYTCKTCGKTLSKKGTDIYYIQENVQVVSCEKQTKKSEKTTGETKNIHTLSCY